MTDARAVGGDLLPDDGPERSAPAWWNNRYLSGDAPWDTGIVPPELHEVVSSGLLSPGWAFDLGCGSGLNARYLARHGWRVIGVDLALAPLARGLQAAQAAGLPAHFILGDVAAYPVAELQAAFALDIGCFHAVSRDHRAAYAAELARLTRSGAYYLLYTFEPWEAADGGPGGVGPADLSIFGIAFTLVWARHGYDGARPSAWYLFRRI